MSRSERRSPAADNQRSLPVSGRVVVVAGPTASGKSALAADIAERFGGVVINADSMQVYRGLEVLSAAPDAALRARVPHRLYGEIDPATPCSAGDWRERAVTEIARAHEADSLPVVCGGTGLYLRSLMTGIARMPPVPEEIRTAIRRRMEQDGSESLHRELAERDPHSAAVLSPGDSQRIARALELLEATGQGLHAWQKGGETLRPDDGLAFFTVLLLPPREALYRAVEARFARMVESGALDEVRALAARKLDPDLPAMKALGVPDLLRHVRGEIDRETAERSAAQATRRYVKRQFTWFRHQIIANVTLETKYSDIEFEKIFPKISNFLLTARG